MVFAYGTKLTILRGQQGQEGAEDQRAKGRKGERALRGAKDWSGINLRYLSGARARRLQVA